VQNFAAAYDLFSTAKATEVVPDRKMLGQAVNATLAADVAAQMAHAAWEVGSAGAEVTDRVTDLVHDILDRREEMLMKG
jgi:3-deoxy-D-manno-octulosonic-acid transferase